MRRVPASRSRAPRARPRRPAPAPASFTLIELLVVVAIIAILAAMLLPALRNARTSARAIECMNRLRQIGTASSIYIDEHAEFIPTGFAIIPSLAPYVGLPTTGNRAFGSPLWWCPFAELNETDRAPGGVMYYPSPFINGDPATPRKKLLPFYANTNIGSNSVNGSGVVDTNFQYRTEIAKPAAVIYLWERRLDDTGNTTDRSNSYHDGLAWASRPQLYGATRHLLFFDAHVEREVITPSNAYPGSRLGP
jgi:prepilin-type N-terminal cleavage/methylation domain-containing protein